MKTPEECIRFLNMIIFDRPLKPNVEDMNFWRAIKEYLKWCSREYPVWETTYKGKPLGYAEDGFIATYLDSKNTGKAERD